MSAAGRTFGGIFLLEALRDPLVRAELGAIFREYVAPPPPPKDPLEPLTVRAAAIESGTSEPNIYKLCERGQLPHHRRGKSIRILRRDLPVRK